MNYIKMLSKVLFVVLAMAVSLSFGTAVHAQEVFTSTYDPDTDTTVWTATDVDYCASGYNGCQLLLIGTIQHGVYVGYSYEISYTNPGVNEWWIDYDMTYDPESGIKTEEYHSDQYVTPGYDQVKWDRYYVTGPDRREISISSSIQWDPEHFVNESYSSTTILDPSTGLALSGTERHGYSSSDGLSYGMICNLTYDENGALMDKQGTITLGTGESAREFKVIFKVINGSVAETKIILKKGKPFIVERELSPLEIAQTIIGQMGSSELKEKKVDEAVLSDVLNKQAVLAEQGTEITNAPAMKMKNMPVDMKN